MDQFQAEGRHYLFRAFYVSKSALPRTWQHPCSHLFCFMQNLLTHSKSWAFGVNFSIWMLNFMLQRCFYLKNIQVSVKNYNRKTFLNIRIWPWRVWKKHDNWRIQMNLVYKMKIGQEAQHCLHHKNYPHLRKQLVSRWSYVFSNFE